jgi:hypothetical protein
MKEETKKQNNPKAFATSSPSCAKYDGHLQEGMTLLDYFAAKAMQAMTNTGTTNDGFEVEASRRAYKIASAMLKEREKHI